MRQDETSTVLAAVQQAAAQLLTLDGGQLRRLRVQVGDAVVELEWPDAPVAATGMASASSPSAGSPWLEAAVPAVRSKDSSPSPVLHEIRSPVVGTFYHAPESGAPPFVQVDDVIDAGEQIGIVEAMKLMNAIHSDRPGRVVNVAVPNGASVEYDECLVLLELEPASTVHDRT